MYVCVSDVSPSVWYQLCQNYTIITRQLWRRASSYKLKSAKYNGNSKGLDAQIHRNVPPSLKNWGVFFKLVKFLVYLNILNNWYLYSSKNNISLLSNLCLHFKPASEHGVHFHFHFHIFTFLNDIFLSFLVLAIFYSKDIFTNFFSPIYCISRMIWDSMKSKLAF